MADLICDLWYSTHHQLSQFLEIWNEDGITPEPKDDFA